VKNSDKAAQNDQEVDTTALFSRCLSDDQDELEIIEQFGFA